jgi:hypothetical protein
MKLTDLLESSHPWQAPKAKEKRLRALLTPEVMAKHHDALLHLIGSKLTLGEIDQLQTHLAGALLDGQDLVETLDLLKHQLRTFSPSKPEHDGFVVQLGLVEHPAMYSVAYNKGTWRIAPISNDIPPLKVVNATEVIDAVKKQHARQVKRDTVFLDVQAALAAANLYVPWHNINTGRIDIRLINSNTKCYIQIALNGAIQLNDNSYQPLGKFKTSTELIAAIKGLTK